jgi:regulatory protein
VVGRHSRGGGGRRGAEDRSRGEADQEKAAEQPEDPVRQAKDVCLRLLTARPQTRAELHQALIRRGYPKEVAEQVLGRLDDAGLVDDAAFAEQWVRSRHTYQGLGRRALVAELRRKGVAEPLAAEAASTLDGEAEEERARQLVRKRLRSMGSADEAAKLRRLAGMLARKGYSQGLAFRVVRDELQRAGADTDLLDDAPPE